MPYVDGYVLAVPKKNKSDYIRLAEEAAVVFKEHGALSVMENWADDAPNGELTSFPMAVKCEADEVVVFSWITWPSREARDIGNKAAMEDPRFQGWISSHPGKCHQGSSETFNARGLAGLFLNGRSNSNH